MIWDVLVIGAGAAGLMTAITAKKAGVPNLLLLDSKEKIGAKILMSGGTRCNLTNEKVLEQDFQTEQKNILRSVLQFFPSDDAIVFFQDLGIEFVREEGGKFFPSTHSGRTVLEALQKEIQNQKIEIHAAKKVTDLTFEKDHFVAAGNDFSYQAKCVILTTGGLSFPATGSDGTGYSLARKFGHRIIETSPSLTPLKSSEQDLKALSGLTLPVKLTLRAQGKKIISYEGSFLFTHFGYSGPVALDISRHWIREMGDHKEIEASFLPEQTEEAFQETLLREIKKWPNRQLTTFLNEWLPKRVTEVILKKVQAVDARLKYAASTSEGVVFNQVTKEARQALLKYIFRHPLQVTGTLGYEKAEVTAGGVDLAEVHRRTLESKLQPGLFFAGEILDVDGRIGGFNFQWAWSSGVVAGLGAAAAHVRGHS